VSSGGIEIAGVRYAYSETGSGPLVVFLHGTLSGKESFDESLRRLRSDYRCVAFDWPGHGESGWDPGGWSADDLVAAMPEMIAGLGEERAVLVGLSQGGAIATRTAIRHPEVVRGLVLINAAPEPPGPEAVEALAKIGRTLQSGDDDARREAAEGLMTIFHAPGWIERNPDVASRELRQILHHPREAMIHVTALPASYRSVLDELGEISAPTLVLWGEHDPRSVRGAEMVERIPDSELGTIPGAGHLATLEAPAEIGEAVAGFLARLDG
jgi:pimeloyl-ACP methyl ester carboxylesterase